MSWLVRSLANLGIPNDDGGGGREGVESERDGGENTRSAAATVVGSSAAPVTGEDGGEEESIARGVKEDLSEITKTLTRQLWGVASFLAPSPSSPSSRQQNPTSPSAAAADADHSSPSDRVLPSDTYDPAVSGELDHTDVVESPRLAGIRGDFAEIGGRFRTGISKLSSNKAVSEITKIASTFLPFGLDGDEEEEEEYRSGGAIGVTEEVMAFARNISMHPETWLDFPLLPEDEDSDDFDMSDAQQEHALAVERLAPRLAALRIELCPSHMSEGCFWKIYFVLLHPRLNKHDAVLLSTPQIVEARAMLHELQNRTKPAPDSDRSGRGSSHEKEDALSGEQVTSAVYESIPLDTNTLKESTSTTEFVTEKHPVVTTEIKIVDKAVIEEQLPVQTKDIPSDASKVSVQSYEDDGDGWLEEDTMEMGDLRITSVPLGDDEDVSFSDLEEEDEKATTSCSKTATNTFDSQVKDSRGWIQLSKSSGDSGKDSKSLSTEMKEANEWSDLEDIDVV